jgi:hypothetical protein
MSFLKIANDHDKKKKFISSTRVSQADLLAEERKKQEDKEREESLLEKEKLLAEIALEKKTLEEKVLDENMEHTNPFAIEPQPTLPQQQDNAILPSPRDSEDNSLPVSEPILATATLLTSMILASNTPPTQEKHQEQIVNEILSGEILFLESITRICVHFKVPFLNKALLHGSEGLSAFLRSILYFYSHFVVGELEIKTLTKIFSFIDRIILFSTDLVQKLKESTNAQTGLDLEKLCDSVTLLIPEMKYDLN